MTTRLHVLRFPGAEHIGREDTQTKKSREILSYSNNETASYIPNIFLDTGAISLPKTLCKHSVETLSATFLKSYIQTKSLAKLLNTALKISEHIKNHVESRLQLFLSQLHIVFQTECTFEKFTTQSQAGVKIKKEKQKKDPSELVEAHASTLANLQYISNEVLYADDLKITDLKPRVLAPRTSHYNNWNMTHKLPRFVNDIDSLIDKNIGIPFFDDFRHFCLKIVNDMARSKNSALRKGYLNFLTNFELVIDKAIAQGGEIYQKVVLGWYKEVAHSYVIGVSQTIFWKTLNYMVRSNTVDPEVDLIPVRLQNRISIELSCLDKISTIKALCGSVQDIYFIVRKIVIDFASIDNRSALIWAQVQKMNKSISRTNSGYIQQCCQTPQICQDVVDQLQNFQSDADFAEKIKTPLSLPIAGKIKTFLTHPGEGSPNGKKSIQNLDYICLKVMETVNSKKGSPLAVQFAKFFHITHSTLEEFSQGKTEFNKNVDILIQNPQVIQLCNELCLEINKLV